MKQETLIKLILLSLALIVVAANAALNYTLGRSRGYREGMDAAREISEKVDCEFDYGYKPLEEVPARCLKYFDLEGLKK